MNISRRNAIGRLGALIGSASLFGLSKGINAANTTLEESDLKGRVRHSVCRWPYNGIPLDDLCRAAKEIGITSIMEAIVETSFEGYVGQEFIPTWDDPIEALNHGVQVCDV